jgi:AcrR family transcriptional regulator
MNNSKKAEEAKVKPKAHDRAATELALLEAASSIFSKKGYDNATTREIAVAAQCAEALIHRYYGGKNGLLVAVVKQGMIKIPSIDISQLPYRDSIEEEVRQVFHATAENLSARAQHIRITFSRALIDPDFDDFKKIVMRPERLAIVESRLRRYQADEKIDRAIDIAAATEMLLGGIFQLSFVHRQVMHISEDEYMAKASGFCTIFARGVAPINEDRRSMQGITELRGVWQEALSDKKPGIPAEDVLNRLERKYQAIANAADAAK